ncbi:MAG: TetR/AcrR family transcriptional regulator [Deltaproteobacteria bacterium]|jgi:AcrR family transcriptional regulator|nr:TetR/AcrR family transcriptional regulator [Deltaproteobacteria bacterium]
MLDCEVITQVFPGDHIPEKLVFLDSLVVFMSQKQQIDLKYKIFGEVVTLPLFDDSSKTKEMIVLESTILFAKRGFGAVSIRDIASQIGVKPSSLYNHFASKEALFDAVVKHAEDLYLLYFKHLDDMLSTAQSFSEALDLIFLEPIRMSNSFTCYAFSLVQTEQFRDRRSAMIYTNTFLDYSINFFKNWFEKFVDRGMAQPFDCKTAATVIMHSVLVGINLRVHEYLNQHPPYSFAEMFSDLKQFIMRQACPDNQTNRPTLPQLPGHVGGTGHMSLEMPALNILGRRDD